MAQTTTVKRCEVCGYYDNDGNSECPRDGGKLKAVPAAESAGAPWAPKKDDPPAADGGNP